MKDLPMNEYEKEGGIVWAVDITGHKTMLTMEDAKYWPFLSRIIPWEFKEGKWIEP